MTANVVAANKTGYALEGVVFTGKGGGPAIDTYRTAGCAYTEIYKSVGNRLGTHNEALILRELHLQDDAEPCSSSQCHRTRTAFRGHSSSCTADTPVTSMRG